MKELLLKGGEIALVDDDVFEKISKIPGVKQWYVLKQRTFSCVCARLIGRGNYTYLSHQVLGQDSALGLRIVYLDGNRLNYQRENLEWRNKGSGRKSETVVKALRSIQITHCPFGATEIVQTQTTGRGLECHQCTKDFPDEYEKCLNLVCTTNWPGWRIQPVFNG